MGIGRNKKAIVAAAVACLLLDAQSAIGFERKGDIWNILRVGQFGGPTNDEAHIRPIKGSIIARGTRYKFWDYYWAEKRPSGHGRELLLVFEQTGNTLSYLGSYEFYGADFHGAVYPEIRGKTVFFPYRDIEIMGVKIPKVISFEDGPPPEAQVGDRDSVKFSR